MPNRLSYQQRPSNYHQSSKNYTNTKNERTSGGAFDFITNRVKNSSPRNSFDMSSWIQNGSVCKASCYSQLRDENELRKQERTTSFSSNNSCYSTEDNSSLNDSFEDANDIKDYVGFENSSWLQGHQGQGDNKEYTSFGQQYYSHSEEETLHRLDLSRLKLNALEEYKKYSNHSKLQSVHTSPPRNASYDKPRRYINQSMLGRRKKKQREWKSAIDPKSGRRYYYDAYTRETQWHKPIELATKAERRAIEDKEKKQRDFFQAMEKNILRSMKVGQVPGSQSYEDEDTVESLPPGKPKVLSKRNKPKPQLLRTISSMDHELLKELTNVEEESRSPFTGQSPDGVRSSFFDSLPQPESQIHNVHSLSSMSTSSNDKDYPPSKLTSKSGDFVSFDKPDLKPMWSPNLSESSSSCSQSTKSKNIPKPNLSKRNNTCGTMYVSTTMAAPDKDAAIKCVCGVYRTHIIHSLNDTSNRTKFDEYEKFNDIIDSKSREAVDSPSRHKAEIVEADSGIELTISLSEDGDVPPLEEIADFFRYIFNKAQLENDTIIMSLIYVERLLRETNGGVRPNLHNWKSLLFSCMIMASKVWDDLSMWNVDFSQASPEGIVFSLKRINELELAVLSCLNYNVKVPASEYAKYYFLMRTMLIRSGLAGEEFKSSKPLDMEGAKKFEIVTSAYNAKASIPRASLRRSKSTGHDGQGENKSPGAPSTVALEQLVNM